MSNKAVSVYAEALKRQAEETNGKTESRRSGHPISQKSGKPETQKATKSNGTSSSKKSGQPDESQGILIAGEMEAVRKVVREVGKERADVGLTAGEKDILREIAFRRTQAGKRTTINDVVRVALNWLLEDHRQRKDKSLLSQTLDAVQN